MRRSDRASDEEGYFFDMRTGEVSYGKKRSWQHRLGPYATAAQAQQALDTIRARNEQWDQGSEWDETDP